VRQALRDRLLAATLWCWAAGPMVDWSIRLATIGLGTNPQELLLRAMGQWIVALLLVILSLPLLEQLFGLGLLRLRRMLGLWCFFYAALHLLAFAQFEHDLLWTAFMRDLFTRPFVTMGTLSFLALLALALTSNRWSQLKLGENWKRLHWMVWPAAWLGIVHYALHKAGKNDFEAPATAALSLCVIWLLRRQQAKKKRAARRAALNRVAHGVE